MLLVGVIEVPSYAEVERKHTARLNSNLWLDIDNARALEKSDRINAAELRVRANPSKWARLLSVAQSRQACLAGRQSLVHYVTGTFRGAHPEAAGRVAR